MFFGCVQAFFCDFGLFPNSIKHKLLFFYLSPSNYVILFAGWYMPTFRLFVAVSKNIRYFVSIFYKTKFIIHRSFQRIIFSNAMLHAKRRCTLCNDFRIDFVDFDIRQKAKIWIQQCNKAFNIFSKRSLTLVIYYQPFHLMTTPMYATKFFSEYFFGLSILHFNLEKHHKKSILKG